MSPADEWGKDRLDELASQVRAVAAVTTLVAVHAAKIDGLEDDLTAIRESLRESVVRTERMMEQVGKTCEAHAARVERKIDAQAVVQRAGKWTPTQWAAVLGPTLAALIGLAAVLLGGGS